MWNPRLLSRSILVVGVCLLLQACILETEVTRRTYQRDITAVSALGALKLNLPSGGSKEAETSYMVAFVAPQYEATMQSAIAGLRETRKRYAEAVAKLVQTQEQAGAQAFWLPGLPYRKIDVAQADYLDQVKKLLQKDLEQILLRKNIRVLGPFPDRDAMTFDEKKRAIYSFTPEIFIAVDTKPKISRTGDMYHEEGDITVSGWLTFTLRETITGEKLWVKRLEADPVSKPYAITTKYKEPYQVEVKTASRPYLLGIIPLHSGEDGQPGVVETDNSDQTLAAALSDFYAGLGDKLWRHIDPEEWEKYLDQAMQIRAGKRF